jgi:TonB family protein
MRAVVSASANVEFGKQWQGQIADGRFPLEQYLGGSEQCAVFSTWLQDKTSGKAAIKLLLAGPDADVRLADWRRVAELSHPHLVRIFESGRCWLSGKELLYVVSEYGDENLAQVVPQRSLTNEEADAMLRPAVQALAFLHDRGLVHGHVRPSNVMAVADQLKLSSDGIRAAGAEPRRSDASTYDPPEAATSQLSPAMDIWSLGVMLFEALTQRVPTSKIVIDSAGLRQPYSDIVRHCLMKNPASRWEVRDIAGAIQLELPRLKPVVPAEKKLSQEAALDSSARRPRLLMPVLILGTLIAAVLAITLTIRVFQHVPTATQQTQSVPQGGEPQAPAQSETATRSNSKGEVLHQVLPDPSASALHTINGHLKVRVQVAVDGAGNVSSAKFVSAGPSKYFARLAMDAAKQWKFTPAVTKGQPSPSEWNLLFEFTRGGVKAIPQQVK